MGYQTVNVCSDNFLNHENFAQQRSRVCELSGWGGPQIHDLCTFFVILLVDMYILEILLQRWTL